MSADQYYQRDGHYVARRALDDARRRLENLTRISPELAPAAEAGARLADEWPRVSFGDLRVRDEWCQRVDLFVVATGLFEENVRRQLGLTSAGGDA